MKNLLIILLIALGLVSVKADQYTATLSITNAPTNGMTLTVSGDVRTWVTIPTNNATQIAVTNVVGWAATNLFNHVIGTKFNATRATRSGTNGIAIISSQVLVVTPSAGYMTVSYQTNTAISGLPVVVPFSSVYNPTDQVSIASSLITGLENTTTAFVTNSPALTNFVGLTTTQTITGAKTFSSINGNLGTLTNGTFTNPIFTNGQNYGAPFRSPGSGIDSEQFGVGASAAGQQSIAFGDGAAANAMNAVALGAFTIANFQNSIAIGSAADSEAYGAISIGVNSSSFASNSVNIGVETSVSVNADNAMALGARASVAYPNSTAIGHDASTTATNQVMLGTASEYVAVPGYLKVDGGAQIVGSITNSHFIGTNTLDGSISHIRHEVTGLVAGNNVVNSSTNGLINLQGSGDANICAINDSYDGKGLTIRNTNTWHMVIVDNSGFDGSTTTNRIRTGIGGSLTLTNRPSWVELRYDGADQLWDVKYHSN